MKRTSSPPDDRLDFLRGFLRRPQQVGSVVPSSRFLERRLTSLAEIGRAKTVVELGPGTGGTTRAVLRAMPADARLIAIELDAEFARLLERVRDPRLTVHRGSATELAAIAAEQRLPPVDAVLSGIPFSTMTAEDGRQVVRQVHGVLSARGLFVAYQIRDRVGELGAEVFGRPQVELELRNIPPVRIYRWRRPATPESGVA